MTDIELARRNRDAETVECANCGQTMRLTSHRVLPGVLMADYLTSNIHPELLGLPDDGRGWVTSYLHRECP